MSIEERRRFSRVSFHATTHISQGNNQCQAELCDISLKGVLLTPSSECTLDPTDLITVSIRLADDAEIVMQTRQARHDGETLGLICESIDVESISHLRRLIELNLGDPNASERELSELMGD
ncbi:PilZ domain-containing protein [Maricurvus nonylphenolicus]|uniref:PilZ domain-containing protein n=1 Tax=Maricurvus nonylphenolicus TaxID=1008307 RepID=UPI0036F3EBF5